jgi:hypothetical protein
VNTSKAKGAGCTGKIFSATGAGMGEEEVEEAVLYIGEVHGLFDGFMVFSHEGTETQKWSFSFSVSVLQWLTFFDINDSMRGSQYYFAGDLTAKTPLSGAKRREGVTRSLAFPRVMASLR